MNPDRNIKETAKHRDATKALEVLFEISEAVTTTRNLDELYRAIHKSLGKILRVNNFYIALHHEEKDSITFPWGFALWKTGFLSG
jgi:transcriptional regulator with GAF, ATPase, and Fis domain